jgi:hypothetical protein
MSEGSSGNTRAPDDTKSTPAPATDTSAGPSRVRKWLKSVRQNSWMIGVFTGLISGVIVAFYLSASGQAALTAIRHHTKPSCSNPQWLLQVPDSQVFTSSYYIQSDKIPGYGSFHVASNTIDGDLSTSWLQLWPSLSTHSGAGLSSDYIEWSFAQPYNVRLICIVDGWAEDLQTYRGLSKTQFEEV